MAGPRNFTVLFGSTIEAAQTAPATLTLSAPSGGVASKGIPPIRKTAHYLPSVAKTATYASSVSKTVRLT